MVPLFFSLGNLLQPIVIRDPEAQLNDQSIPTYTYNIYQDMALRHPRQSKSKEGTLRTERNNDPEYYGFLTLKSPGALFSYTAGGRNKLSGDEVEQLIELIEA